MGFLNEDPLEVWNGEKAQAIRRSILTGEFNYCTSHCPYLHQPGGSDKPVQFVEEIKNPRLLKIIEKNLVKLEETPEVVHLNNDKSCQLSCPQCRRQVEMVREVDTREIQIAKKLLPGAKFLSVAGAGDPLASPAYRHFLQSNNSYDYPNLEIYLHTNGLLVSRLWNTLGLRQSIKKMQISIDAATPGSYIKIRRGGRWDNLQENLTYISSLKRNGDLKEVHVSFVVQETNWREMADFVGMATSYDFDLVMFALIRPKGYHGQEYKSHAVHLPEHPNHEKFIEYLQDNYDFLNRPQGNLRILGGEVLSLAKKRRMMI